MTSFDMFTDRPRSIAARRRGLAEGSPPPARAATPISRITLVKILPRCASTAFLRASMEGPRPMGDPVGVLRRGAILQPEASGPEERDRVVRRLRRKQQA